MSKTDNILIPSVRHEIWGWPAAVNLMLGGTAAGFFLFGFLETEWFHHATGTSPFFRYTLVCPLLVVAGFITVGIEAGRPMRGKFLLHHVKRSWMSREVFSGLLFILFALADWIHPLPVLKALGVSAAVSLMVCQGFMVFRARAVTAWAGLLIPCYFVTSALVLGFGLTLVWSAALTRTVLTSPLLLIGLIGICVNLTAWFSLVRPKTDPIEDSSWFHLRDPLSMTLTIGFGHLVPGLLLISLTILAEADYAGDATHLLYLFTSVCILTGGIIQKTALILQANTLLPIRSGQPRYNQPICP
jgi:DMSO reductase anchor subunit